MSAYRVGCAKTDITPPIGMPYLGFPADRHPPIKGSGPFRGETQALRIGDALLTALPGEVFCQTGLEMKRRFHPLTVLPVGYANGYLGYFIPPDAWKKDTYETGLGPWCKVGPEAEEILVKEITKLAGRIFSGPRQLGQSC